MRWVYYIPLLSVLLLLFSVNPSPLQSREADKRLDLAGTAEFSTAVSGSQVVFVGESHLSRLDHAVHAGKTSRC